MQDEFIKYKYVSEEYKQKLLKFLNEIFDGKILLLSLTGSRAYGWANDKFDYDVHGVFSKYSFFDTLHHGFNQLGCDLNLYELSELVSRIYYRSSELIINLANPFYTNNFSITDVYDLLDSSFGWYDSFIHDYNVYIQSQSPRSALHCYRLALIPIYFFNFNEFEHNIFAINQALGYKLIGIYLAREHYLGQNGILQPRRPYNHKVILAELDYLKSKLKETLEKVPSKFTKEKFFELSKKWFLEHYGFIPEWVKNI
jgi:hypothetical protein